jgi:hypothetical protein
LGGLKKQICVKKIGDIWARNLKKITAHMVAAALLIVVSTSLVATPLVGDIDGNLSTGYLIGGAGSGGGVGLGSAVHHDRQANRTDKLLKQQTIKLS